MMMAYGKDYEVSYIVSTNFRANLDAQNAGNAELLTLDEGPSLETSSFCLFISGSTSNITTQHSIF